MMSMYERSQDSLLKLFRYESMSKERLTKKVQGIHVRSGGKREEGMDGVKDTLSD